MRILKSWAPLLKTVRAAAPKIIEFAAVQGVVQFLNALSGFIIVRTLSKNDYAQFAIVNSMQSTCNLLADLGIGIGMRSISGRVWNNREHLGSLLRQATQLRLRFAAIVFAVCLPTLAWMLWRSGATIQRNALLTAIVFLATFPLLITSPLSIILQFHSELRKIQNLDLGIAITRVTSFLALSRLSLTSLTASFVPAVTNWIQLLIQRPWALKYVDLNGPLIPEHRLELLKLSFRSLPNMLYFCFQGQITILLLSYFGNSNSIADVTALTRISAPLALYATVFTTIFGAKFSRNQDPASFTRMYFLLVGGTIAIFSPLPVIAHFFPGPFMWLIGPKYASLSGQCTLVMLIAVVTQVAGSLWCLNYSKGWIKFYLSSFIPLTLLAQIALFKALDLNSTRGALLFTLGTSCLPIPIYVADAWLGIRRSRTQPTPA